MEVACLLSSPVSVPFLRAEPPRLLTLGYELVSQVLSRLNQLGLAQVQHIVPMLWEQKNKFKLVQGCSSDWSGQLKLRVGLHGALSSRLRVSFSKTKPVQYRRLTLI